MFIRERLVGMEILKLPILEELTQKKVLPVSSMMN
jgi:hypothetical protein